MRERIERAAAGMAFGALAVVTLVVMAGVVAVGPREGGSRPGQDALASNQGVLLPATSNLPLAAAPRPPTVGGGAEAASEPTSTDEATATLANARITEIPQVDKTPFATPSMATATVVTALDAGSLEAQVRAAVQAYFPASEWARAMRVAWCESRFQPWAVEPGGAHFGVFQTDPSLHGPVPVDIDGQVRQAAAVWRAGGWAMWSCR